MKIEIKDLIDIKEVLETLSKLPGYRKIEEKIEYKQRNILFGVLYSMFAGNSEMVDMHNWLDCWNKNKFDMGLDKGRHYKFHGLPFFKIY